MKIDVGFSQIMFQTMVEITTINKKTYTKNQQSNSKCRGLLIITHNPLVLIKPTLQGKMGK